MTGAVLAGVYKVSNLQEAQDRFGVVAIFWDHDLTPLLDFLREG